MNSIRKKAKRLLCLSALALLLAAPAGAWGQTWDDGLYYLKSSSNTWYLWPSIVTNSSTGLRYLTTYTSTTAPSLETSPAPDDIWCMWVVKNVTVEGNSYIQLINPKFGKYVIIRDKAFGDRDVWLDDIPSGDATRSYFQLTNQNGSYYRISPTKAYAGNEAEYASRSFNSASGDKNGLGSGASGTGTNDERPGLIQLYNGDPKWTTETAVMPAPTISDVSASNTITIADANGLAAGYTIRYTTDDTDPTATTGTEYTEPVWVADSWTVKAVVVCYGIVLTSVATKAVAPALTSPVISFDNATNKASITCATDGATIYYNTGDGSQADPTSSSSTYGTPFDVTSPTTVKAISSLGGLTSPVVTFSIAQAATPTIQNSGSNAVSITSATDGATIYYTTDGSTPTTSSTLYTASLTENVSGVTIKAIAVKEGMITSAVGSGAVTLQCAAPVIVRSSNTSITITCAFPSTGVTVYYTTDGSTTPTTSTPTYILSGGSVTVDLTTPVTVKAIATATNYDNSTVTTTTISADMGGTGTALDPYTIEYQSNVADFVTKANTVAGASAYYRVTSAEPLDFSSAAAITQPFSGTFDGNLQTLTGLTHALFNTVDSGTVKNVILDNVALSGGTNVGAICNEAKGGSRIYNCGVLATGSTVEKDDDGYDDITTCSSTVSGSGFVGGIVGLLDDSSRVINCFSYANITGGNLVGGIVGKNNVATTSTNLKTMVMNCMFYGDITGGTSKAPVYNGEIITNRSDASGVGNFNYFWLGASYVQGDDIDVYNCALAAETRFLQRFEFFRHMLNSNRELAAWWVTGDAGDKDEIKKWVLEPSQIGTATPYPILKASGYYPSVVNIDAANAEAFSGDAATAKTQYNQGRKFSTTFTINIRNASSGAPTNAAITTASVTRNITDKDPTHFNFNYYKVQLPYYNDVGSYNYTDNKVVTGWKIVAISGGTHAYSTGSDATAAVDANGDITLTTPYNFADRKCTDKDKYSESGRVFSQGAYFDVPEGVTSITIEPYWGKCVYVSDEYPDVVYNQDMSSKSDVTTVGGGQRYANNTAYSINGSSQKVYTTMTNAVSALNPSGTVYDNAIVLVGNVHSLDLSNKTNSKPYTIMSIDLDEDNEPDYSYVLRFNGRLRVHPVRVDFLNVIGLGMAQKSSGGTGTYNFGIMQPYGWFEVTNTALFRVTQFEYDREGRTNSPMILHGGVIEQWVTMGQAEESAKEGKTVTYYHVGGNVWFKEFHIGVHQDKTQKEFVSPHPPISVTGGDFNEFYLTGLYSSPDSTYGDNAECYINGGRFSKVAGTGMQGLGKTGGADNTGNIVWQIDNADIDEFYAGGTNAAHIAEGNITTVISNSRVDLFCGGPKFGDMNTGKTVVTNATNCTFRTFFGAGYGGNSYNRRYPKNKSSVTGNINWDTWLTGDASYDYSYSSDYGGVETRIDYQFIPMSDNKTNVARLFIDYVSFSLATTYDVTTKLTGCTITASPLGRLDLTYGLGNFYGGGSLGKVDGPVKSTLTDCIVEGNVFGAGYSATLPTVAVMNNSFQTQPYYNGNLGVYLDAVFPSTVSYTWEHAETVNSTATAINRTTKKLFTTVDLSKTNLGSVTTATLTLKGSTTVGTFDGGGALTSGGNVYGGGDESTVGGNATVLLQGGAHVGGNVFGGGNRGAVGGNSSVTIQDP